MSKSYDDKIVRMGFENAKFEKNAAQTMSTLDKLNEKLKLKGASEGSSNVQRSIDSLNFAAMERAIANIERRFSTLGIMGMNVINQITNGITGSVKQLEAATIGQIKTGGWSRAMNIANAKFQIEGLGFAWEEVEKAVSYGVKDTAYGLDAAASAASQLAASGVDFKKTLKTVNGQDLTAMHKSLRAISGVAAMTNSSYEDIARIFTTVAGNGRLMGDQLLQLSSRGMNAAAKLAEVLKTTEEDVRDMVSRGKIDFQTFAFAMDDAFGAHAKEANKTFTGALGNMKAALSRVGEIFASPIINKTNTLFISLTERIDEFKNKLKSIKVPRTLDEIKKQYDGITLSATAYDQMLKGMEGRTVTFGEHFSEMWQSGIDAFSAMIKSVDISWFDKIVEKVDSVTVKIKDFFDLIKEIYSDSAEEAADGINDATQTLLVSAKEAQAAKDIILKGMYGSGQKRVDMLTELFGGGEKGAKHAKNVQAYIDSVIAAGWSYEKAAIKVEKSDKNVGKSQGKVARDVKKAKLKAVIDNITGALSDLWTTAKNIGHAISAIVKPIINAFASVFNINVSTVSSKTKSLTKLIADASSKLIISDKTAGKIQNVFTKIFTIVKTVFDKIKKLFNTLSPYVSAGIEKIKKFIASVQDSKLFTTIKNLFSTIYNALTGEDTKTLEDSPLLSSIEEIIDSMKGVVSDNEETPKSFTDFINKIIDGIMGIKWGDVAKIGIATGAILTVADFIDSVKSLSGIVISIGKIPKTISDFFESMGDAIESAGNVLEITSVAGSLAIVALSLVVLSQIPDEQLYKAVGVMIVIAAIIKWMTKTADVVNNSEKTIKESVGKLSSAFQLAKTLYAVGIALLAFSGSIAILSVALAIIEKSNAANGEAFLTLVGMVSALTIVTYALTKMVSTIDSKTMVKLPALLATMPILFIGIGAAVLAMSGAIAILSKVPTESFGIVITLLAVMLGGLAVILNLATEAKATSLLAAAATISSIGAGMASIIMSIAGASVLISTAASILTTSKVKPETYILVISGIAALFFATLFLANMANNATDFAKVAVTLLAMSVAMNSIGSATLLIALALSLITQIGEDKVDNALLVLATILGGLVVIMYMATALKPTQMLASAVMFMGMASAIVLLSAAISLLSIVGTKNMLDAAGAIFIVLIGIGVSFELASRAFEHASKSASTVVIGMIVMTAAIGIIAAALAKLGDVKNLGNSALALVGVMVAVAAVIAVLSILTGSKGGDGSSLFNVGLAFIMISAAFLVFAVAIDALSKAVSGPGFATAIGVIIVFTVVVGALMAVAALLPGATQAFEAVGKAFLYAGIGAALVGAAVLLVCAGIKLLAPAVGVLAISLNALFTVLEEHKVTAIVLGVVLLAIIAAITIAIIKFAPVLEAIANTVSTVAKAIGNVISSGTNKLKGWVSNLSTKGKATIAALIVTLCGAIMKASPTVLETVGKLLIKLLAFLGSIAGDIAMGLLDFLINLINGLADAIRANSARIAAALWGVVISLVDLVIQIVGQLAYMLVAPFSEKAANGIQDFINSASDGINQYAMEQRKAAEEADKSKRDYIQSMKDMAGATEESAEKSKFSLGSLTDVMKSEFGEQKSELDVLKDQYNDLPGYAYDAILRSQNSQNAALSGSGKEGADSFLNGFTGEFEHGGGGSSWDPVNAMGFGTEGAEMAGIESGTTYTTTEAETIAGGSDELYQASDESMKSGAQQAIVDNKEDTKKAVQDNFNVPAQATIRSGHQSMYDAAEYSVDGAVEYIETEGTKKYRSVMTALARAGDEAFRSFNKIESPSKLYYQNGAYIVEGVANSIIQNTHNAEDAMTSLSEAIIVSFGNPIEYLSKISSGELVYDPSIRPVFDSSGLYRGASSVNSMLAKQTVSVSGFSGKLAADIGTLDRSNADVVSEIRALREDISYMEDAIADMQVVMDTGALVGTMAGPMDKELGKRAIYRGRGN